MKICKKCGKELEKDEVFCSECGTKVENEVVEPTLSAGKEKKYKRKKMLIVSGIIICFLIIGVVVFLFINDEKDNKTEETGEQETEIQSEETEEFDESEYIFPYSDKEYLTDADIENLTEEELGFARNEIIARHGRIYTDDTYKAYFESKSWYKGTIEPEVFDENYDKELNEIEKANIELIQKYEEELKADEIVEQYYSDILKEYQTGETEGYPGSESKYPNVNPILYGYKNDSYLYYALVDLCSDGMPELFIGTPGIDDASEYTILDMYGYAEGKTERFLDGVGLSPAPINKGIGDHERYYICENLMMKKEETNGEGEDTTTFYQMKKDSTTLLFQESVVNNRDSYYWSDDGLSLNNGTKEQYESTRNKYAVKTDISWHKLADLELETGAEEEENLNAEEVYEPILQQYRNQKGQIMTGGDVDLNQNGIDDFTENNPDLNRNIFGNTGEMPEGLSYIMLDIDNNGVPELFIADVATDSTNPYTIYDMYTCSDGKPQRIFDISEMGINAYYTICENGVIVKAEKMGSNIRYSFYGLEADGTQAVFLEGVEIYVGSLYIRLLADGSTEEIDVESCENLLNTYPAKINMDWIKL